MFINSDFSDLLSLFRSKNVKYLVIGGYAVIQHRGVHSGPGTLGFMRQGSSGPLCLWAFTIHCGNHLLRKFANDQCERRTLGHS
jgi:hypothetical protein